ncbi:hypothetical protein BDV26DRAFT_290463 [Aspergillus bertholletiae]|uniref:Uncharacterized protein n=1 Tax=Aspergillus bertholletiae TaxID=1226010 RepID=A0A5N7BF75_9EURO|nr:hypothetical protein BDV26DRAFT_290463 [Aspergillus bertholletiae]
MKFTAALALLPLAASAWEVTTGYWKSSETDVCAKAFLPKGFHVTINDLLPGQKVFFFSDDDCDDLAFSINQGGTVKLESRVKSFTNIEAPGAFEILVVHHQYNSLSRVDNNIHS